ncbi:MAG: cupin domain-containing protein [Verrucomicrobiaceae bacterium]|nr:MAG: cupin domain-containing protein [Verrucomicrobiaceae bacterium]
MTPSIHPTIARRDFIKFTGTAAAALAIPALGQGQTTTEPPATMKITRNGSQPSTKPSAENFTGTVRLDSPFKADAPARLSGGIVTFEPGARTNWHTHPLGQTLIVTSGVGLVQCWDGPIEEIRPGDVVRFPPGVKHWHGASPTTAMAHIAITEQLDGITSEWLEKVSDEQYQPQSQQR